MVDDDSKKGRKSLASQLVLQGRRDSHLAPTHSLLFPLLVAG